ncbi:Asp-tRNA(Asn)/Glu-tRNA(Gln) amidotransferase GatCAB subunit B [Candidatus Wolfebacteria bacterium CG10_big_fil_rev_8_21_14_0_10_31_9]|uniref:Aspartyl/glutamyl-tRNA(Asn/Gln) amidotransferase subunit B n=1 Tax=Candidatus Wolfebacteria bacterium CG10_big_fil_rev_8_21_14_0_10_31_9 TaxID=1975070 RepID=A0A2H0RCE0_9BACT|nr:MAG: Asp-tRNA(Asn)/Glu-tRNA(Gln) amidotransferase GatCAB subunit B [Candidatus Wolfebacteria bacterium CG10_big_fil_rev_8_21_14_0_10_31_9]
MAEYIPTIGLEIHAELNTKTKMFCPCKNDANEKNPNINICPICVGHPGTLPTINKEAIFSVIKIGLAMNSEIAFPKKQSKFDRKNYFYPDLPKAYQISQYDQPIVKGGELKGVKLTRIHMEEDTARSIHSSQVTTYPKDQSPASLVDFNRSGLPLMELVTEPDVKSGKQAVEFAKELQLVLRYLGISDADMEKGQMRVEANVSISKNSERGTKVEVKNLNSFVSVEKAIDYEIKRQEEVLEKGEKVAHETRGWNDAKKITVSQRIKELAHDYRYFPEPDLPLMDFSEIELEQLKKGLPELPREKRGRFIKEYKLSLNQANLLVCDKELANYFENTISEYKTFEIDNNYQIVYNYITTNLKGLMNEAGVGIKEIKIEPEKMAHLTSFVSNGKLTSNMTKDVLKVMFDTGADPESIIKEKGFYEMLGDKELEKTIDEIINENEKAVNDYKKGNENSLQFLTGQAMKKLKGRASAEILIGLFKNKLK